MITPSMTVAEVLDRYPQTLAVFVAQHRAFQRLRNPLLRGALARLVTVAQAAQIARISLEPFVTALNAACGLAGPAPAAAAQPAAPAEVAAPAWYAPARIAAILDVRDHQRAGTGPIAAIMQAAQRLEPGAILFLRSIFEPIPLYEVLGRRGLEHWARGADDDWQVFFYRPPDQAGADRPPRRAAEPAACLVLDNRGLAPPEPMMRTLAALDGLAPGGALLALTDRQPMLLCEALAEQDYLYETAATADEGWWTVITRPTD